MEVRKVSNSEGKQITQLNVMLVKLKIPLHTLRRKHISKFLNFLLDTALLYFHQNINLIKYPLPFLKKLKQYVQYYRV